MSGKLIVLTGAHRIVSELISTDTKVFSETSCYPSILDDLKQRDTTGHWKTCPFLESLLLCREMERDSEILPRLRESHATAFVEQWHIGNIAWAKALFPEGKREYTEKTSGLGRIGGIVVQVWYVSTDLEKIASTEFRTLYQTYLQELSSLIQTLEFPAETLNGDAPPDFTSRRIMYLLAKADSQ